MTLVRALAVLATLSLSPTAGSAEGTSAAERKGCDCDHGAATGSAASAPGSAAPAAAPAPLAAPATAPDPAAARGGAKIELPDEALLDQHGKRVKLVSELIRDRIVVMDFVFTTCTTICPLLSGIMTSLQSALGEGAGDEVALVTVTVDPARDTPARLAAYAAKWHAGPGWTFLTGERDAVKRVLEAAGAYTADFTAHPPMVLVGDGRTGSWVRLNGFPKRAQVLQEIAALRARREALSAATAKGTSP